MSLEVLATSALAGGPQTAVSYLGQQDLARQQNAYQKELMTEQANLNANAERMSAVRRVESLKAAGLSPALIAGQGFSTIGAGSSPSVPLPHMDSVSPDVAGILGAVSQMRQLKAGTENLEADTKKKEAEAESQRIENEHKKSEDKNYDESFPKFINELSASTENPFLKGWLEEYQDSNEKWNLGSVNAFSKMWFEFSQKERDRELDYLAKEFDKRVLELQFENGAAAALADLPKATRYQIYRNCELMSVQMAALAADTSLTPERREQMQANIKELGQKTLQLYHNDPAAMWQSGDISALLAMLGYNVTSEAAKGLAAGGAFGMAGKMSSSVAKGAVKAAKNASKAAESPKGVSKGIDSARAYNWAATRQKQLRE